MIIGEIAVDVTFTTDVTSFKEVAAKDIARVVREFEAASAVWSKLGVGESMTLVWRAPRPNGRRPRG